jgi:antitoxin component YwqK of YwqJK toxin-antitoxin module
MMNSEQSATSGSQLLQGLELDQRLYQALVEDVRQFCETRAYILSRAKGWRAKGWLTSARSHDSGAFSFGVPPFVIDDGETCFSFLSEDGSAVPLPYGYELDDEDIDLPDDAAIFSTIGSTNCGLIRFIPVSKAFSVPDDDSFALEHQLVNELGKFDFEGLSVRDEIYSDAESGELYTGHAVLHWPDGSLRKEADFLDGLLDSKMTWWYENGQKELEDNYVANLRHGTHRAWHDNGQLMSQGESIHGQRQGSWLWWHDNGQLAEETAYLDDEPLKKSTFWYSSGAKKLTTSYMDGLEHGKQATWFENGQRSTELELENGVKNGVLVFWHESGAQAGEIHVVNDQKHGPEKRWDEAGQLIEERNWSHGEEED